MSAKIATVELRQTGRNGKDQQMPRRDMLAVIWKIKRAERQTANMLSLVVAATESPESDSKR